MGPMLCPRIAQVVQRSLRSARLPEVRDTGQHVDDRLGGEARYRRGSDVLHTTAQPRLQGCLQHLTFHLKGGHPGRVVQDKHHSALDHLQTVLSGSDHWRSVARPAAASA